MTINTRLLEALKEIADLTANSNSDPNVMGVALDKAVSVASAAIKKHEDEKSQCYSTPQEIERARKQYGSDDIEIDDGAQASRTDAGMWVAGWLWLRDADSDE